MKSSERSNVAATEKAIKQHANLSEDRKEAIQNQLQEAWIALNNAASIADNNGAPTLSTDIRIMRSEIGRLQGQLI